MLTQNKSEGLIWNWKEIKKKKKNLPVLNLSESDIEDVNWWYEDLLVDKPENSESCTK